MARRPDPDDRLAAGHERAHHGNLRVGQNTPANADDGRVGHGKDSKARQVVPIVVAAKDGKETTVTLTPSTTGADKIKDLVGKSVKVVAEHGKADSVAAGS